MFRELTRINKKLTGEIRDITTKLSHKFTQDDEYIKNEIEKFLKATLLLELTPEHICGKIVEES